MSCLTFPNNALNTPAFLMESHSQVGRMAGVVASRLVKRVILTVLQTAADIPRQLISYKAGKYLCSAIKE